MTRKTKWKTCVLMIGISSVFVVAWLLLDTLLTERQRIGKWQLSDPGSCCPCHERKQPRSFVDPQTFQSLDASLSAKGRPCALVYSAFFDPRDHAVKVVADSDMLCYRHIRVNCQIWYPSSSVPYISSLNFHHHMLEVERGDRLGVVYSCCASSNSSAERPVAVSFFANDDECMCSAIISMRIHQPQSLVHQFSVCVAPLFGNISVENLNAFVEIHRILGAEKFYFYNENVSQHVEELLRSYQREGVAEVLSWKSMFPELLTYHNQQAMQADCLLRNLKQAIWVAQIDVDEVIMPANGLNWSAMVKKFGKSDTGVFTVLNRDYSTDESTTCDDLNGGRSTVARNASISNSLSTASHTPAYFRRLSYHHVAYGAGSRSKTLYNPEKTAQARTHYAVLRLGFHEVVLSYNQAALKHYEDVPRSSSNKFIRDTSICAYADRLNPRLKRRWD